MTAAPTRPRVLLVGGEDVDARIEIMRALQDDFELAAAGTARELGPRFAGAGFEYFYYPLGRGSAGLRDAYATAVLVRLLWRYRPDAVHTFDTKPCVYGRLAARLAGVPVVVGTLPGLGSLYVAGGPARRLVKTVYERLQRWASHVADLTVFQNEDDAREFVGKGIVPADRHRVIHGSGVRTDVFDPDCVSADERRRVRAELGVPADAVLVTMVSRVIPAKGVEEFLEAAAAVRGRHPAAAFLLVGPADSQSVDRYGPADLERIRATVNWPGPRRDVPAVLAASDVFVLPSFYREGIPRSLLEAASMGLPVVTTRSPGCADVVVDGVNGFLVPTHDGPALAAAVTRLVQGPELRRRYGAESRRRAVELFDLAKVADETRAAYRALLHAAGRNGTPT